MLPADVQQQSDRDGATGEERPLLCPVDTAEEHLRKRNAKATFKEENQKLTKIQCEPLKEEWFSAENNLSSRNIHGHTKLESL